MTNLSELNNSDLDKLRVERVIAAKRENVFHKLRAVAVELGNPIKAPGAGHTFNLGSIVLEHATSATGERITVWVSDKTVCRYHFHYHGIPNFIILGEWLAPLLECYAEALNQIDERVASKARAHRRVLLGMLE